MENTYTNLCNKYGQEVIDKLDNYIYFQIQKYGYVNVNGKPIPTNDYMKWYNADYKLKNYDFEDDDYAFQKWYEHQAELDEMRMQGYDENFVNS